ncbi:MAG: immunoglobulin domain-containing protein, partial [Verrucomicrobiales bacterium]|nr:immunoglobulin domain-containing protein [Verrucomicrobiales bacterium]
RTTDGTNFSPIRIDISGIADNDVRNGLAFYTNNTFWAQRVGRPLFLIRYGLVDSLTATGQVIASFSSALSPLACVPEANLLAGISTTTPGQLRLFNIASLPPTLLAQTNFLVANANGNLTGAVAFGGPGKTNRLYALWSNNGIKAAAINWAPPPAPPSITGQPTGATVYTNFPAFTFNVTAVGSPPPTYQWLFNGVPIPGATASAYTKTGPFSLADAGNYSVIVSNSSGVVTSAPAALVVLEPEQTAFMTRLWAITNGTRSYLQNDNNSRGMDYDPVTDTLVIVSRTGATNAIYVVSATNGADLFQLNTAGITSGGGSGTFGLNMIGVADDGVVYAGNLTVNNADGNYILYRWDSVSPTATPAYAFNDNPAPGQNLRWGDTIAVRGAGTSTEILIGSAGVSGGSPGQYVALLTTSDGFNFVSHPLVAPPGVPNDFARLGIAFGHTNTFWTKSAGFRLRHFSYDPTFTSSTLTLLGEYDLPSRLVPTTGISVATNLNLLAAVEVANPDNLQLYRLPPTTNPPVLLDQEFFPTDNPNGNQTAAVAFGTNNTLFALDSNNGILAMSLNPAAAEPQLRFTRIALTNAPAPGAVLTWRTLVGGAYQLQFKGALTDPTWTDLGALQFANGLTHTFSDTGSGFSNRFYRVVRQP